MIDIHSHILPAVDNGAVNMNQTKNMLEIAYSEGIDYIIATPHYGAGCRNPSREELTNKLEEVRKEARKIDKNFHIELGQELFYSDDIAEHLRKKKALTMAGTRYILIEFASTDSYEDIKVGMHNLLIHGYLPILAHVERYEQLYQNYEGIANMIQLGAYMQMNVSSITGTRKDKVTGFCKKLIEYGLIHLVGTNSHTDNTRAPNVKEGIEVIKNKFGKEVVQQLLFENTAKLLKNEYI